MATKIPPPFEAYDGKRPYLFVSYSHKDSDVVFKEITRLHDLRCRIWYDDGIVATSEWSSVIETKLEGCSLFLVYITGRSRESENVKDEINYAIKQNKTFLYVCLEDVTLPDGMALRMSRLQGILKYELDEDTYQRKLLKGIPDELRDPPPPPGSPTEPSYAPNICVLIKDSAGTETKLTDFGVVYNPHATEESAVKDCLIVERGSASQTIPWNLIDSVVADSRDAASISLRDGRSLDNVKLRSGRLVGTDELGFAFVLESSNWHKITVRRDISVPEREALMRDIPILAKRTLPNSSYTCALKLEPDLEGVLVTIDIFFQNEPAPNGTQTFRLPGRHTFSASDSSVSLMIASKGSFNLGRYDRGTARTLAHALNRLNTLLQADKT